VTADSQARLEKAIARLREQGHRLTPQRMAVLRVLLENAEHLSAEQIYERVRADFPMTSLATIYKTVAMLKKMGEIAELRFSDDSNRYDSRLHPHPHLICIKCKKIIDMDIANLAALAEQVARQTDYQIVNSRLDFFGICPQCREAS